jgi:hypothetical protein
MSNNQNQKRRALLAPPPPELVHRKRNEFTVGSEVTVEDLAAFSPMKVPAAPEDFLPLFLNGLYQAADKLCLHEARKVKGGFVPVGDPQIGSVEDICEFVKDPNCLPELSLEKKEWQFRINPVQEEGNGRKGFHLKTDIADYRYTLLEIDDAPKDLQAGIMARLPIPISAIIDTGNRSLHAIVKVAASDWEDHHRNSLELNRALWSLGFDQNVYHANQMSRLPGSVRLKTGLKHRLVYLNSAPSPKPILS